MQFVLHLAGWSPGHFLHGRGRLVVQYCGGKILCMVLKQITLSSTILKVETPFFNFFFIFHCPAVTSARLLWLAVPVARVYIPYETHRPSQLTTRTMWAARRACAGDGVGQARARAARDARGRGGGPGTRAARWQSGTARRGSWPLLC